MSMLTIVRDTAALVELDRQLQQVRETQLRAARDGRRMPGSELADAEARVVEAVKRQFYCIEARLAFMPEKEADALTDAADHAGRQLADSEQCLLEGHRRILSVPCVGDPGYDDLESEHLP